jgi:tripartite-type tricarboxylate transporter receptor subunit TctC
VAFMVENLPTALPLVKAGKLRALAVTGAQRTSLLPGVPTVAEQGFPGFEITAWFGVQAPAGTPEEIITLLSKEIQAAIQAPAVREKLATHGAEAVSNTPQQFEMYMRSESEKWRRIVRDSGASVD